MTDAVQYTTKV